MSWFGLLAIAVALAHKLPAAEIYATEISAPALAVARQNAERESLVPVIDVQLRPRLHHR